MSTKNKKPKTTKKKKDVVRKITFTLNDTKETMMHSCHQLSALELLGLSEAIKAHALELMGELKTTGTCDCKVQKEKVGWTSIKEWTQPTLFLKTRVIEVIPKSVSGDHPVYCISENGKPKKLVVELTETETHK